MKLLASRRKKSRVFSRARADEAVRRLRETHPDEVPEILVFDVAGGDPDYLDWVAEEVKP